MRFYSSATNSRGKTVGTGGGERGQETHARGWLCGVKVVSKTEGRYDVFEIYQTGGSSNSGEDKRIGVIRNGVYQPD